MQSLARNGSHRINQRESNMPKTCLYLNSYILLFTIVSRGKGSKVLDFAMSHGAKEATCLLGEGISQKSILQFFQLGDVEKEIAIMVIDQREEEEIIQGLNDAFSLEEQGKGIAFTIPLAGLLCLQKGREVQWIHHSSEESVGEASLYSLAVLIVDKGRADNILEIVQEAGFFGGTILKGHGHALARNLVLDMIVEPEKEIMLMLFARKRKNELRDILEDKVQLHRPNTGILGIIDVHRSKGVYTSE